jgi:hypothetical protein
MWIKSDDAVGEVKYLLRLELLFYHPTVGICCILDGHQIADDVLHGRVQHGFDTAYSLSAYNVSRLDE